MNFDFRRDFNKPNKNSHSINNIQNRPNTGNKTRRFHDFGPSFKPKITRKSEEIVENRRRFKLEKTLLKLLNLDNENQVEWLGFRCYSE